MKIKSLIAAASMFLCGTATAQYVHFTEVPEIYTSNKAAYYGLFNCATYEFKDILIMGDSQETCPGGQGSVYVVQLNYGAFTIFGPATRTPWIGYYSTSGGGTPWAEWLVQTANAGGGVGPLVQGPTTILPNFGGCITSTNTGPNVRGIQWYGQLFGLNVNGQNTDPNNLLLPDTFIVTGPTMSFETIVVNNVNNSNVVFQAKPNNVVTNDYFRPITSTVVSNVNTAINGGYTRFFTHGLSFGNNSRLQVEVSGDNPNKTIEIICSRFMSPTLNQGMIFTDASAGGYTATSIINNHNLSGDFLSTLNPNAIMITYGANDSGQGKTAAQFETDVRNLMSWVRQYLPNTLFILASDPFRTQSSQTKYDNMDLYSSALYNIALTDPSVLFVNSRLITHNLGWTPSNYTPYLSDGVHYTGLGGRVKANAEWQAIYEYIIYPGCPADYNTDCAVTIDDLVTYLEDFELGILTTDVNNDGGVTIDDLILFLESFERGC